MPLFSFQISNFKFEIASRLPRHLTFAREAIPPHPFVFRSRRLLVGHGFSRDISLQPSEKRIPPLGGFLAEPCLLAFATDSFPPRSERPRRLLFAFQFVSNFQLQILNRTSHFLTRRNAYYLPTLNLEGLIRKIQRRRRSTHLAQGGSPGTQGRRNAPPLAQPHPRKRLFALLSQIRLARMPTVQFQI